MSMAFGVSENGANKAKQRAGIVFKIKVKKQSPKVPDSTKNMQPTCKICQREDMEHYTCADCGRQFLCKLAMIAHLRKHKRPPAICRICYQEFEFFHSLRQHMVKHSDERQFACEICQKTYKRYSTLIIHKHVHERKQFSCKTCTKSFAQKIQLEVHMRLHSGVKPYECSICLKQFTQLTSLNNHILKHTGVKPHRCAICKERFRQVSNLKQHMQRNHADEYDACYKSFKKRSKLKKSQDEDKPRDETKNKRLSISLAWYSCNKCKKMLTGSHNIRKHKKMCV